MQIRIGFDLSVDRTVPTSLVLALSPRPEENARIAHSTKLAIYPTAPLQPFTDAFGNHRIRIVAATGPLRMIWNGIATDDGQPDAVFPDAPPAPVDTLPDDTLQFLTPSRFCESDLLVGEAWERFGRIEGAWAQVQAIADFVHAHVGFGYVHASPTKTAFDALREGRGVCRDYAHLTIAFCRAMNIPARYVSGYLGDIGVPYGGPGDFCAWAEVFVAGGWRTIDARYNVPRIGRIKMVHGRDAADVPMIAAFGNIRMTAFKVWCDEVASPIHIFDRQSRPAAEAGRAVA